jgi:hypothetical protein
METILDDHSDQRIIFHFNKHYLVDNTTPMWVVKHKGKTYYVDHIDSEIGFRTKNTPDNEATKGSLQFKGALAITKTDNITEAWISSALEK